MSDRPADPFRELFGLLADRAADRLRADPPLAAAVAAAATAAARAVAAWADQLRAAPAAAPPPAPEPVTEPAGLAPAVPEPLPEPDTEPLSTAALNALLIHSFSPPPPPPPVYSTPDEDRGIAPADLGVIARRCRLKAAACGLVARRNAGRDPTGPTEMELKRAGDAVPDCHLWMLFPGDYVSAPKAWEDLGGAFGAAAEAVELLQVFGGLPEGLADRHRRTVLYLAAEAQALLWAAVADVHRRNDNDQMHLFVHVREQARVARLFIDRFLKKEDRVPPESWADLLRRCGEQKAALSGSRTQTKTRQKSLSNLKYKLRKLHDEPGAAGDEWPRVLELLEEVVAAGVPPSNADLRDWLIPVLDTMPDELCPGPNARLVFRAADEYLAAKAAAAGEKEEPEPPTPEVAAAAELLRGTQVVLIGGVERAHAREALERAFGLASLNWISTREHESVTYFETAVANPAVSVVLLAIRWSSHSYGEVQAYCDKYGKLLVRLPRGYNPNQVAAEILRQVGDRLRGLGRAG